MKKLKFLPGGQPFRSTDFELIQNAILSGFDNVLSGIVTQNTILTGLENDIPEVSVPGTPFTVQEGFIYDLQEICRVPLATFNLDGSKTLYLRLANVEISERLIGGVLNYVMTERLYNIVYVAAPIAGDIGLLPLPRLSIVKLSDATLLEDPHPVELNAGYAATVGGGLYIHANQLNEIMIVCTFTATSAFGTLTTLPAQARPSADCAGWYRAGNSIVPLVIRTNGNVELVGSVTSGSNVIRFQFSI